jgi:PadR family transcriptional regulator PadR
MPRHRRGWALGGQASNGQRHTPLIVSLLEPALLHLLSEHDGHAYNLLTELEGLGLGSIHPSVVYRTLREFEALQWVTSSLDREQTQGPPRRTYRLTLLGKETLERWQNELEKADKLVAHLLGRA